MAAVVGTERNFAQAYCAVLVQGAKKENSSKDPIFSRNSGVRHVKASLCLRSQFVGGHRQSDTHVEYVPLVIELERTSFDTHTIAKKATGS